MKKIKFIFLTLIGAYCLPSFSQGVWTQKADFGGTARSGAVGFSIGSKGYIGTGVDNNSNRFKDFWEYNSMNNTWTQKADFGGTARYGAVSFSINDKGYIGTGQDGITPYTKDFWEYDTTSNAWTQKQDVGGVGRYAACYFSIASKGYVVGGYSSTFLSDVWEYNPVTDTWVQKPSSHYTLSSTGFTIGSKGYACIGGESISPSKELWEYDPVSDIWTQKVDLDTVGRTAGAGFSIGTKGYIGTGYKWGGIYYKDFWEWDQATNTWAQIASFGGTARANDVGFTIGTKGYVGTGGVASSPYVKRDFWEYDPSANSVNELNKQISISVYPNPSNGIFTISSSDFRNAIVDVFNLNGEIVYQSTNLPIHHLTIDLSSRSKGIYFIKIQSEENFFTEKVIVQ